MHAFSKGTYEYAVFDFARSNELNWLPWGVIENMKNGWMTSTKYDSKMMRFKSVKIIVFMNESPPMDKFSQDRYEMFYLRDVQNMK